MHVHASFMEFLIFAAYLMVAGFFIRTLSAKLGDRPVGKALAFIY